MTTFTRSRAVVSGAAILALALVGCGDQPAGDGGRTEAPADQPETLVEVSVDDGAGDTPSFALTCGAEPAFDGDAGARDAAAACEALEAHHDRLVELSAPDREPEMCTEVYGGPDTATINGRVDDDIVDVTIDRTNGCGIADWDALEPLLGEPRGTIE